MGFEWNFKISIEIGPTVERDVPTIAAAAAGHLPTHSWRGLFFFHPQGAVHCPVISLPLVNVKTLAIV